MTEHSSEQYANFLYQLEIDRARSSADNISSLGGHWFAFDTGSGVCADGVNTCAGVMAKDFIAHVHSERSDSDLQDLVTAMQEEGIKVVDIYGVAKPGGQANLILPRLQAVFRDAGITIRGVIEVPDDSSFIMLTKDGNQDVFLSDDSGTLSKLPTKGF